MKEVKTTLIPWQYEAIFVELPTKRKLTVEEERIINGVICQRRPGVLPKLTELVDEVEEVDSELAKLIIVPDEMSQLNQLNSEIDSLRAQLEKAELRKKKLMEKIHNSEHAVIDAMPGYIQNNLRRLCITTDFQLNRFIDGEFTEKDFKVHLIDDYSYFKRAKTRKERLMLFRGVGEKTAEEAVRIIEEKGM